MRLNVHENESFTRRVAHICEEVKQNKKSPLAKNLIPSISIVLEERMKSNLFKRVTLFSMASMILAACGGGAPAATQAPAEKVKVVIFVGMGTGTDPEQVDAQNALAEKFNSTHDNIEIEFLIVPHE